MDEFNIVLKLKDEVDLKELSKFGFILDAGASVGTNDFSDIYVDDNYGCIKLFEYSDMVIIDRPDNVMHRHIIFDYGYKNLNETLKEPFDFNTFIDQFFWPLDDDELKAINKLYDAGFLEAYNKDGKQVPEVFVSLKNHFKERFN